MLLELIATLEAPAADAAAGGVLARLSLGAALAATGPAEPTNPGKADPGNIHPAAVPDRSARRGLMGRFARHRLLATVLGTTERQVAERSSAWLPDPDEPLGD